MNMLIRISGSASGLRPMALNACPAASPMPMPGPIAPRPMASATASELGIITRNLLISSGRSRSLPVQNVKVIYAIAEIVPRVAIQAVIQSVPNQRLRRAARCSHLPLFILPVFRLGLVLAFLVLVRSGRHLHEDQRQQCEDQRLHKGDEQFEGDEDHVSYRRQQEGEERQDRAAREDVAKETEGEREQARDFGDQLDDADEKLDRSLRAVREQGFELE